MAPRAGDTGLQQASLRNSAGLSGSAWGKTLDSRGQQPQELARHGGTVYDRRAQHDIENL